MPTATKTSVPRRAIVLLGPKMVLALDGGEIARDRIVSGEGSNSWRPGALLLDSHAAEYDLTLGILASKLPINWLGEAAGSNLEAVANYAL